MTDPRQFLRNAKASAIRKATISELNDALSGPTIPTEAENAILAEKDRRLSDPNSPDFRPQFH